MAIPDEVTSFCPCVEGVGKVMLDEKKNLILDGFTNAQKAEIRKQFKATFPDADQPEEPAAPTQ